MRVSNSLWTVGVLLSGVSQSSQKAIPDAALAARQHGIPPPQTVTIPGTVSTVTGATLTQVVTETVSARTTTVTEDGTPVISTFPAQNTVKTKVIQVSPYPVPLPGSVTVVTPISKVTLCPEPTGRDGTNLRADKSLLFGCAAGFVCNPPKPDSCNLWPGVPSQDFACRPEDCILAPPTRNEFTLNGKEVAKYSPAWGYFHLDPRPFGLSYDIFEYGSSGNAKRDTNNRKQSSKRQSPGEGTPQLCIVDCSIALRRGEEHGAPGLCEDPPFRDALGGCRGCIVEWARTQNITNPNLRNYVGDFLDNWIYFCDGQQPGTTLSDSGPPAVVTSTSGTISTVTGDIPSTSSFQPITTTNSTTTSSTTSITSDTTSVISITSVANSTSLSTSSSITSDATSSETSVSTASPTTTSTSAIGTPSFPSFPIPSATSGNGTSPGFGGSSPTPSTTVIPTNVPVPPPSSAVAQLPAGFTLLAMLCTALALLL